MSTPPLAFENNNSLNKENKILSSEKYEMITNNKKFNFTMSYDDLNINLEIEEVNSMPKKEYRISKDLSELKKLDKYFLLFDKIDETFNSFKKLFSEKNINLLEENNKMKIKIKNTITNKEFFIDIPPKIINIKDEINNLYNYCNLMQSKITNLEKEVGEIKIENKKLKEKNLEYENQIKENSLRINKLESKLLEKEILLKEKETNDNENNMSIYFDKSNIVKKNEINTILGWLNIKPKSFKLLLDSRYDGDKTNTFYEKCGHEKPSITFIKSTKGYRFGGFTNVFWPDNGFKTDPDSFIFSLDKKRKYKVIKSDEAIYLQKGYGFCFGDNSIFLYNNSSKRDDNITENNKSHEFMDNINDLNNGDSSFSVTSYEVYKINI